MNNFQNLTEIEDAIMRYLESSPATKEDILDAFSSKSYSKGLLKDILKELSELRGYIELSEDAYLKPGVYDLFSDTTNTDFEYHYELTALGKAYLARSTSTFTSYSNISNSNIAHQSPHAKQTIKISDQSRDIQEKFKELQAAITHKDIPAIKKAFGYIADKSVDVAIAILTGNILR